MCADSQEVVGDYKWPVKKVAFPRISDGKTQILITGAGFGPAIDVATQKIFSRIVLSGLSYEQTIRAVEEVLRNVYEKDLPIHPFPADQTDFRLLLALRCFDGSGLLTTSGSLVVKVPSFEVIGAGAITKFFAHMMYRETSWGSPQLSMSDGMVLAAYLIHLAKGQLSNVGGTSQIITMDLEGNMVFASNWEVPAWESFFSEYQFTSGQVMLDCADPTLSEHDFNSRLDKRVAALKAKKKALIERRAEWDAVWKDINDSGGFLTGHTPTSKLTPKD